MRNPMSPVGGAVAAWPPFQRTKRLLPGFLIALVVALAAAHISEQYGGPVMLTALLLGMAFNFLAAEERYAAGLGFSTRAVLKLGVALLGLRITFADIASLGLTPIMLVLSGLVVTLGTGWGVARALGLSKQFAILTGGAVAICGASAAMAIAAALPRYAGIERDTIFTVISVTALSTVAMVVYPLLVPTLGLSDTAAGMFLGGTIHDVAQVVGAGYTVSEEAGDVATFTKLLRVALLVPLISVIVVYSRRVEGQHSRGLVGVPPFLLGFVGLVVANSVGWVPPGLSATLVEVSRNCLVIAIAALGVKSSLKELTALGRSAIALVVLETVILAGFAAGMLAR